MVLLVQHFEVGDNSTPTNENYYEGNHVRFSREARDGVGWIVVNIENRDCSSSVEICDTEIVRLFLMNKEGKTIETRRSEHLINIEAKRT